MKPGDQVGPWVVGNVVTVPVPKPRVHQKDHDFLVWLRDQDCWVCTNRAQLIPRNAVEAVGLSIVYGLTEAAHVESRRYGDVENAFPLCRLHHRDGKWSWHRLGGRERFEKHWKVDTIELAHWYYWSYLQWKQQAAW